jgi:hypothetical protein
MTDKMEPVAWMDDGSLRSGSESTAFRVVSAETKSTMPSASAVNFTIPLYTADQVKELTDRARNEALEEAFLANQAVREHVIYGGLRQYVDGFRKGYDRADAAIRALKDQPND